MAKNPGLSARATAVLIVQECVESGQSLATLLPQYLPTLASQQRPLAQEICYGVLRWYYRLNPLLEQMLSKPLKGKKRPLHYLLLVGLYQIIYLDKAAYAIVKETVNSSIELNQSWAKGLVNAILRRFLREKEDLLGALDHSFSSLYAYPEWLISAVKASWQKSIWPQGDRSVASILEAGNQRPPMTLRINNQLLAEDYQRQLQENGIAFSSPVSHANPHAIILDKPSAVEQLPLFAQGGVSVQDAAAQWAALLLGAKKNERVLDACAAPGGKTMHILEQQPELQQLVAMDVSAKRLQRVQQSAERLQVPENKLQLLVADASEQDWWDGQFFDRILLDAPCSATGVIRRHPDIKVLRRQEDIQALTVVQASILDNLWTMLKPGGVLLYATCSILREENERQVQDFLARHSHRETGVSAREVIIEADWGYALSVGRQILPGERDMDGFYYALIEKHVAVDTSEGEPVHC